MAASRTFSVSWTHRGLANCILYPVSLIYGALVALDRWRFTAGLSARTSIAVPVVVVGNITTGGTGKSPLTRAIAAHLVSQGLAPGIVLRGYGGSNARGSDALRVDASSDPEIVGDEALEHALFAGVPVAVAASRADAAILLVEQAGCDVIISDDGLQHHALERDIEIAVVDGRAGVGNGWLLPAGPLREPVSRLNRVEHVVVNASEQDAAGFSGQPRMRVSVEAVQSLVGNATPLAVDQSPLAGAPEVYAVAGLGNAERFFAALEATGLTISGIAFPDHHRFSVEDLPLAGDAPVLMSGKDMVKINTLFEPDDAVRQRLWCATARARVDAGWLDGLTAQIWAVSAADDAPPRV